MFLITLALVTTASPPGDDKACIPLYGDCTKPEDQRRCCYHSPTTTCFMKDQWYSQCLDSCGHDPTTRDWVRCDARPRESPGRSTFPMTLLTSAYLPLCCATQNCSHPPPGPEPPAFSCEHYVTGLPICVPTNKTGGVSLKSCEENCTYVPPTPGPVPGICDPNHGGKPASRATGCKCLDPMGSGVALACKKAPDGECKIPEHDGTPAARSAPSSLLSPTP
jgi:hypothetical protein